MHVRRRSLLMAGQPEIVLVNSASGGTNSSTSQSIPAGAQPGDVVVWVSVAGVGYTTATGFTTLGERSSSAGYLHASYKVQPSPVDTSIAVTVPGNYKYSILVFRNVASAVIDATATTAAMSNHPDPPAITTATRRAATLVIGAVNSVATSMSISTGWTKITEDYSSGEKHATGWRHESLPGAVDPGAFTASALGVSLAITVALKRLNA